MEKSKENYYL